jgi:hypothetical protein
MNVEPSIPPVIADVPFGFTRNDVVLPIASARTFGWKARVGE